MEIRGQSRNANHSERSYIERVQQEQSMGNL
jgi:hypothetical protein